MYRKRGQVKLEPSPCQHGILLQVQRKITASTRSRSSTYSARFDVTTKTQIRTGWVCIVYTREEIHVTQTTTVLTSNVCHRVDIIADEDPRLLTSSENSV